LIAAHAFGVVTTGREVALVFFVDMMVSVSAAIVILRTGRLSAVCVGWSRKLRISGAISPVEMIKFT